MSYLALFCDGGSRGNPGPAAGGFVVYCLEKPIMKITEIDLQELTILNQGGSFLGSTTNNQAEYQAVLLGLKNILELGGKNSEIQVFLDSLLVVNQVNGTWKMKNQDLKPWQIKIREISKEFQKISFTHIYREYNTAADRVVNEILDGV